MSCFSPRPRAIVFDLDGTLVHSLPGLAVCLNALLAEDGLAPLAESDIRRMVGEGVTRLVTRGYAARGWGEESDAPDDPRIVARLATFKTRYAADPVTGASAFPGATAVLEALAGVGLGLGLCTNKPEAPTHRILDALGLARFLPVVVGGDTLPVRKPDPAPLRLVLDRLGVPPAQALYVGDSPTDVACARAVGVPVVVVRQGYSRVALEDLGADALVADLPALGAALGLPLPQPEPTPPQGRTAGSRGRAEGVDATA